MIKKEKNHILLEFLLVGHVVKASEFFPGSDLIKLGLAALLLALGSAGGTLLVILLALQQNRVAVGLLPLLAPPQPVLLPQHPPLLPHLLHPALVVIRAVLLGAGSPLGLLVLVRLEARSRNQGRKTAQGM